MRLDSKYYSFCKEIGLMKENYGHQQALDSIKKSVAQTRAADPAFIAKVQQLTLTSPEVSMRVCILYKYDIDLHYVVGGNIKDGKVNEFGASGVPDSLYITKYQGNGEYTVLKDVSTVPYGIFNSNNLFTFDEMKNALTKVVEKKLPSNTTSFKSTNWSVSAYFVPVLTIVVKHNGKDYAMNYNLQNGHYHWNYPDDPALIKKGKETKLYTVLIKMGAFFFNLIGMLVGISGDPTFLSVVLPLLLFITNIIVCKKIAKKKSYYEKLYIKNPDKSMVTALIPAFVVAGIGFLSILLGLIF